MTSKEKFLDLEYQEAKLKRHTESFLPPEEQRIILALNVARDEHSGQLRHGGVPYIIHPIRAALILLEELSIRDSNMVCALLLHDVCEDGTIAIQELEDRFGPEIAHLVKGLTRVRPENETEGEKKQNKLEYIQKLAQSSEKTVKILKLCDVLDNARSWAFLPKDHSAYEKMPRWKNELSHYLKIAKDIDSEIFKPLNAILGRVLSEEADSDQ